MINFFNPQSGRIKGDQNNSLRTINSVSNLQTTLNRVSVKSVVDKPETELFSVFVEGSVKAPRQWCYDNRARHIRNQVEGGTHFRFYDKETAAKFKLFFN